MLLLRLSLHHTTMSVCVGTHGISKSDVFSLDHGTCVWTRHCSWIWIVYIWMNSVVYMCTIPTMNILIVCMSVYKCLSRSEIHCPCERCMSVCMCDCVFKIQNNAWFSIHFYCDIENVIKTVIKTHIKNKLVDVSISNWVILFKIIIFLM